MDMKTLFDFSSRCVTLENKDRVIVGTSSTGEWVKISKECYEIILKAIKQKYSFKEFLEVFAMESDKEYMERLLIQMENHHIIEQSSHIEREVPKYITFAITNKCNLRCKHCCVSAADQPDVLSLSDCKNIILKLIELRPEQIIFTGGEPLIRDDFLQLLKFTRSNFDKHIGIMTNGLLLTEENLPDIVRLVDSIDISLDGVDEESCSEIRGHGVFTYVLKIVDRLKKLEFSNISLSMVVTQQNSIHTERFNELNARLGTKPMLRSFSPIGRGVINRDKLEVEGDLLKQATKESENSADAASDMEICTCGALMKNIYIDYHGLLYPCPVLLDEEYCFGNILEKGDLKEYFNKSVFGEENYRSLIELYPTNYHTCKDCNVNLFCWSCLHHVDLHKKGIMLKTTNCKIRKKELQKIIWDDGE